MIQFFDSVRSMLPGLRLPLRATTVATSKGVVLISPFAFSARQLGEIRALGEVVALVHPSLHHASYAAAAKAHFPRAALWGVEGLPEKKPAITWNFVLGRDPWPFEDELRALPLRGARKLGETVFYHPATRSLIVMDLVFNLQSRTGPLAPLMFRLLRIYKRFGVSTIVAKSVDDREAFANSLREVLAWDFDRLVMAHGEIVSGNARAKLEGALREAGLI